MLFNIIPKKRKNIFSSLGNAMATIFKCALKLFSSTYISTEHADKTATITVTYTTVITP